MTAAGRPRLGSPTRGQLLRPLVLNRRRGLVSCGVPAVPSPRLTIRLVRAVVAISGVSAVVAARLTLPQRLPTAAGRYSAARCPARGRLCPASGRRPLPGRGLPARVVVLRVGAGAQDRPPRVVGRAGHDGGRGRRGRYLVRSLLGRWLYRQGDGLGRRGSRRCGVGRLCLGAGFDHDGGDGERADEQERERRPREGCVVARSILRGQMAGRCRRGQGSTHREGRRVRRQRSGDGCGCCGAGRLRFRPPAAHRTRLARASR